MSEPSPVRIVTQRLVVTLPPPEAAPRLLTYFVDNRDHLEPWEPPLPREFLTEAYQADRLARARVDLAEDRAARLYLFDRERGEEADVIGLVSISQIVRASFQSCMLGYSIARSSEGQGLMREALQATINFVWEGLRLHRIQANYVPTNERSGGLLRRLGFVVEGYARDYVFINGAWRDHVLTAITNPANRPPGS